MGIASYATFNIGQLVSHKLFSYRGVIIDIDPIFMLSEQWYEQVAQSRPPKDAPWYRVLVDGTETETYVAQQNLSPDREKTAINHPHIDEYFVALIDGVYKRRQSGH
ncbi:heat shock protein HspQ [Magnetococcus sp. PR-3]|uniref:heat shock protein HspQ n=1 Tax=Magnetococcus sp. PR-3 TaxID=3120355 RepID=UPI002FCDFD2D